MAAGAVLFGYGLEFGYGAITNLLNPAGEPSHAIPASQIIANQVPFWAIGLWFATMACLLIGVAAALSPHQPDRRSPLRAAVEEGAVMPWVGDRTAPPGTGLVTLGAVWVSLLVGYLAVDAAQRLGVWPPTTNTWPSLGAADGLKLGVIAATGEEPLVLILPVLLWHHVRGRRTDPATVCFLTMLIAARMLYHLYYGPGALAMLPWAITVVVLYWRWRQSWALLLGHWSYYIHNASTAWWMPWLMLTIGVLVIAAGTWHRHHHSPLDRTGDSRSRM